MALEPIFDLVGTLEAIESRLPRGKLVAKGLLSLGAACAGWVMIRFLALDLFWPAGQLMVRAFSGTITFSPKLAVPWALGAGAAAAIAFGLERWIHFIESRISGRLNELNTTLQRYQSIFWKPLDESEKKQLTATLTGLGKHSVSVSAHENTDCAELAHDLRDCFEEAGWTVARIPLTGTWNAAGASGFTVWQKAGIEALNTVVLNALVKAAKGPIQGHLVEKQDGPDVSILVGPRRIRND